MQHQENNIAKRRISKQNYKDKLLVEGRTDTIHKNKRIKHFL
jgi:hypothetical protein